MANEAYRPNTAQDLIKMYNLDALIADRKQTKASAEKIKVLEETSNSLKDFAEEVEKQIEDLEKIADGKITTYYYSGVPTLTNFPANEWAVEDYENHVGDMYYDKETGYAYKFLFDNELNEYLWRKETNPELIEALAKANNALEIAEGAQATANTAQGVANSAQNTANNAQGVANSAQNIANSKMQVFVDTPYPPYQVGDLWLKDDKTIYRCRAEKESGSYSENDWKVATDFTNDDYAKNVEEQFNQYKVTVEKDYATKVQLETTKDEINLSVEGLTTKTETLEDELKGKADVINVTELTQRVDLVKTTTEFNVTAIEKLEVNDIEQSEKIAEFEVTVDGVSTTIENQNNQISKVIQTVEELNSKIGDLADITTSLESNNGKLEFDNINQSEPIRIVIRPNNESISYLYPSSGLYPTNEYAPATQGLVPSATLTPSNSLVPRTSRPAQDVLYPKTRTLRFHNKTTDEIFDLVLPDDILYYDSENYDEFILDYDGLSCVINKKVGWNADATTYVLDNPTTKEYEYPHLEITDGDYEITLLGYDNVYMFIRLMAQNIYTTQFATKAELNSEISQTSQAINLSVDKKLESYSTTTEMNAQIRISANSINQSVSQKVGKNEVVSSINNAIKDGQGVIELKSNSVIIEADNFNLSADGTIRAKNGTFEGEITSTEGNVGGWDLDETGLSNGTYFIKKNGYSNIYTMADIFIVQLMINNVISTPMPDTELFKHYDLNNDGVIDLKDMVRIQSMILGKI